jgi:hypothetical protein
LPAERAYTALEPKLEVELLQLRRDVEELRQENAEMKETIEQNKKAIKNTRRRSMSLAIRSYYNSLWLILGSLFAADGWNKFKDMLGIGELSKAIVVKGNGAAHHADEFADATMWRLGYIKGLELDSPLDHTEGLYTRSFKRISLEVYGKTVDRFAGGIPYRDQSKQIPSALEMRDIEATFNLYTSPPTLTATAKETENHL